MINHMLQAVWIYKKQNYLKTMFYDQPQHGRLKMFEQNKKRHIVQLVELLTSDW